MENKILNGVIIFAAGVVGIKFIKSTIEYKKQMKEHEEIMEDSEKE